MRIDHPQVVANCQSAAGDGHLAPEVAKNGPDPERESIFYLNAFDNYTHYILGKSIRYYSE